MIFMDQCSVANDVSMHEYMFADIFLVKMQENRCSYVNL
jgi:hypothetical protein